MKNKKPLMWTTPPKIKELPTYEVPQVTSYTDEEILKELGPTLANTNSGEINR